MKSGGDETNPAREIIARFGGQSALARSLGLSQSTVQYWARTGEIPSWRQPQVRQAAAARGIQLGPTTPAPSAPLPATPLPRAPAGGSFGGLPHGRADTLPQPGSTEESVSALRGEIGELRDLLHRLLDEVAALRRAASGEPAGGVPDGTARDGPDR